MFTSGFRATKCKTASKLCVSRIKLLKNKRTIQLGQMQKEIAALLKEGKDEYAWIRVEAVHREKNLLAGYEILELYLELVAVRAQLLEKSKEAPKDMVEALTSLMYAAPRIADIPELFEVRKVIAVKFGKELGVEAPNASEPASWQVNLNLRKYLSVESPEPEEKLSLLSRIAKEQGVEFDIDEFAKSVIVYSDHPPPPRPEVARPTAQQQGVSKTPFPGLVSQDTAAKPAELPPGWAGAFKTVARPPHPEPETVEPTEQFHQPLGPASPGPPLEPNFKPPVENPSRGAYTDAQEAAIAAFNAAEDARRAAEEARRYADQIPRPPVVAGIPDEESIVHTEAATSQQESWPPKFVEKSPEELQQQYDAAAGPPAKCDDGPPSAPPVVSEDEELPDVPNGAPPHPVDDELPGVSHLPGSINMPPPSVELDELEERFEKLRKR